MSHLATRRYQNIKKQFKALYMHGSPTALDRLNLDFRE